ncbi:TonB-dependent receptor [Pseudoduganella albidiflava]|uniref:TonB-dependent receptor n=1 Tax=Pseudoduganella albidiflava TaxID=321983 RepID=A0A411X138_9BURK|nr:TonB-dependent receptor [Pseudoduganella albidiflava]QBI02585.1 TonB-dependent receptor [Pseudoduganella albidiflava]GGY41580.1 TonB-dependent receptor [Pseudoduganella albidiflava]
MNHPCPGRASDARRNPFALNIVAAALAGAGLLAAAPALAQDAQVAAEKELAEAQKAQPVNAVIVTGVRKAAQSAQAIKRNSDEVVDSIVAEEAGKFPDKNVAEILGRVTGVQIRREFGEANGVIVRGLPGLATLLNGREVFTSSGRNLYLSDIPTTMLQRIDVYKTQGAEMVEGGTAGVIDVRTSRPFDFKGFTANLNGRIEHRDKSNTNDPQVSGMLSNRWKGAFGEVGVLAGLSYQKGNYHDEVTWNSAPEHPVAGNRTVTGPFDVGHVNYQGERMRYAGNWAVQWRPVREVELFAEGWSTRIDHDAERQFFTGHLGWNAQPWTPSGGVEWGAGQYTNPTYTLFPGTSQVDSVTATRPAGNYHFFAASGSQAPRDDSEGHQGAIGARWDVTPKLRVTAELARTISRWKQEMPIMELLADPQTITARTYVNGGAWFDYPGTDMMNPNSYRLGAFTDNWSGSRGQSTDWRADATWDNGEDHLFREFSTGVRVASRKASYQHESNNFVPAHANLPAVSALPGGAVCPSMQLSEDYGMNQWLTLCGDYMHANIDAVRKMYLRDGMTEPWPYSRYSNMEDTTAFYAKTKFGFAVGGIPVEGTAGVRYVKTELDVNGFSNVQNNPVPAHRNTSDNDILPNLTLKALLTPDLIARFNAGKAIQRPNFGDFNPGETLGTAPNGQGIYEGNGGNPDLKPVVGKNYDVALEWYFAPTGSLTTTLFKHDFENYIVRRFGMETIGGREYRMDRPRNVNEGQLKGIEIGYRQFYDFLPGWLGGFGLEANYTYMKGHLLEGSVRNPFVGMSKNAYNLVGLYERGPWSARLAWNYRSQFVDAYNYRALGFDLIVEPIKTADASLSYRFNDNMGVTLDVENITDRTYNDYHGIASNPRDVRRYDRVVGLSLRWRM